ncbi:hypothetical protein ACSBR2_021911 [Camellia fascicularis]
MAMSVCKSWPWNPLLLSPIQLCSLFYFVITLYYFPLHATAISFNFTNIDETLKNCDILVEGEIYFSNQGIQITPTNQVWKAGRASYKDPLYLWNKTSETLTDFNTYFSFVIDSQGNSSFGDGCCHGPGAAMGLPVKSIEPPQQTSFVAVEFDTYQNPDWDPQNITPGTHVGIDINCVISNVTKVWYNNIPSGIENEAWISYDSNSKNLSVVFTRYVSNGKIKSTLSFSVDLRDYLPEWVTIGFSAATGESYEKHTVKSWSFNSSFPAVTSSPRKKIKVALIAGLIVGSSALVGGLAFFGFVLWKKRREREEGEEFPFAHEMCMDDEFEAGMGPKKFSYEELDRATNNFGDEQKLGEGGFGGVYKGLAFALLYLHEGWEQCVVHRDVKSSNVMLDSNSNVKLGDFGLARFVDHGKDAQTTNVAGTKGYMAPEYLFTSKVSKESDVYSFGIIALEIACGRKPIDLKVHESQTVLVEWVWNLYGTGRLLEAAMDPKICPNFVEKEMECLIIVGLWCAHPDHNLRPTINQAIHVLNFQAPLPKLPTKMPMATCLAFTYDVVNLEESMP